MTCFGSSSSDDLDKLGYALAVLGRAVSGLLSRQDTIRPLSTFKYVYIISLSFRIHVVHTIILIRCFVQ